MPSLPTEILNHCNKSSVDPPEMRTVTKIMIWVAVRIIFPGCVSELLTDNPNAIAPLNPDRNNIC